jgi:DNA-binding GntR family transcriptional regulator
MSGQGRSQTRTGAVPTTGPTDGLRQPPFGQHSEFAYDQIKNAILDGQLPPGARLVEAQLATELVISRTPVREALRRLLIDELVSRGPTGVLVVHAPTRREIDDTYAIREALDGLAAWMAAQRISDADLAAARRTVEVIRKCAMAGSVPDVVAANAAFHDSLYLATANSRLIRMGRGLRDFVLLYSREVLGDAVRAAQVIGEHEAIIAALEARDPDAAEAAARRHVRNARQNLARAQLAAPDTT